MSGRKKGPKAKIQAAKPEPPPFIARLREQIVASEDAERREKSEKRRRERGGNLRANEEEDDPTVVKINQDDLTEEEYKRMKLDLETQYKLDDGTKTNGQNELDIDSLIESRKSSQVEAEKVAGNRLSVEARHKKGYEQQASSSSSSQRKERTEKNSKKLSYGSSSSSSSGGEED